MTWQIRTELFNFFLIAALLYRITGHMSAARKTSDSLISWFELTIHHWRFRKLLQGVRHSKEIKVFSFYETNPSSIPSIVYGLCASLDMNTKHTGCCFSLHISSPIKETSYCCPTSHCPNFQLLDQMQITNYSLES